MPHRKLLHPAQEAAAGLPHVCTAEPLARAATRFVEEKTAEALCDVLADPSLCEGFEDAQDAAALQSSLVGTTIFKSEW
eukprot:2701206-Prymnesium_polylepis.1